MSNPGYLAFSTQAWHLTNDAGKKEQNRGLPQSHPGVPCLHHEGYSQFTHLLLCQGLVPLCVGVRSTWRLRCRVHGDSLISFRRVCCFCCCCCCFCDGVVVAQSCSTFFFSGVPFVPLSTQYFFLRFPFPVRFVLIPTRSCFSLTYVVRVFAISFSL
jgi:hypothetical protein